MCASNVAIGVESVPIGVESVPIGTESVPIGENAVTLTAVRPVQALPVVLLRQFMRLDWSMQHKQIRSVSVPLFLTLGRSIAEAAFSV